jgi:hypothetical protein
VVPPVGLERDPDLRPREVEAVTARLALLLGARRLESRQDEHDLVFERRTGLVAELGHELPGNIRDHDAASSG